MKKIYSRLSVQNSLAQDCLIAGVFEEVNAEFKEFLKKGEIAPKPLMICSGGTSSRCAASGYWTLDLRKKHQQIEFDHKNKTVEIGGGINMASLLNKLSKNNRSFPTGLSGLPGVGYILTGGISPLSRSQGLGIDQILRIEGVWGKGEYFKISKPTISSRSKDHLLWRGLCGAAPFFGIVTKLMLKTQPLTRLTVWEASIRKEQLIEAIHQAEVWPNSLSLQWIWGYKVNIYVVTANDNKLTNVALKKLQKDFPGSESLQISEASSLKDIPSFTLQVPDRKIQVKIHSEVVGLLAPPWAESGPQIINCLANLLSKRPNENCYIAAQQLGGISSQISRTKTSFIHRKAIWKIWITASWCAEDLKGREESLSWLKEVWIFLEPHCPGVHLAQMHQHLSWHKKETKKAFEEWLPGLQDLKSKYDPQGILPRL